MKPRANYYKIDVVQYREPEPVDWQNRLVLAGLWVVFLLVLGVWGEWIGGVTW